VLRMRLISLGNSLSGVSDAYHASYTNCSMDTWASQRVHQTSHPACLLSCEAVTGWIAGFLCQHNTSCISLIPALCDVKANSCNSSSKEQDCRSVCPRVPMWELLQVDAHVFRLQQLTSCMMLPQRVSHACSTREEPTCSLHLLSVLLEGTGGVRGV
jgi:hypothetical protein